jgi:anaerobic magnesium-protoporphyrin IX monomethyl ester cyclase
MRVLLVYPRPAQETPQRTPPLSVLYVGAYAQRRGHEVDYFDERWDTDFEAKLDKAQIVAVSAMSGYQLGRAIHYLKLAHAAGKPTIMGGVHCTIAPETCIPEPYIDYLVTGEGEETFVDLLAHLDRPELVAGVWTKNAEQPLGFYTGDRLLLSGDQIESPIDSRTLRYFRLAAETNDVMLPASRGCPYSCGFCINSIAKKKWRATPLQKWIADLDSLLGQGIKIPFIQIGDDWLGDKQRVLSIGKELAVRSVQWHLSIRATQIDEELAGGINNLGCEGVSIGVESGSEEMLTLMNKGITVADCVRAARLLAQYNLKPLYYFILGFPTETTAQRRMSMDLADRLYKIHAGDCSIVFYVYNPQAGTKLHELAVRLGSKLPKTLKEWCAYDRSNTSDACLNAIYYIAGLNFHRTKGDKTDKNFPGLRRLLILPFEAICVLRWRRRFFGWFWLEKCAIRFIINNLKVKIGGEK